MIIGIVGFYYIIFSFYYYGTYFKLSLHSSEDIITIEISAGGSNTDSGTEIRV